MFLENVLYTKDVYAVSQLSLDWELLEGSSVLLTGASGMIGTVLIDVLMRRNQAFSSQIQVFALVRNQTRCRERFMKYLHSPLFTVLQGDINQSIDFSDKFDYIFHCASNTHPESYASDPINTILTNVKGTDEVLKLALKNKSRRVLFLSSVEIYGENRGDVERFAEDDCGYINCNTLRAGYPEGKRTGEALCQAYIYKHGLDVVIPRICRVYGPTMLPDDSKALSQFIKNAVDGRDIILKSQGRQLYSYCYVIDVVTALFYLLLDGKCGQAYNIADPGSDIYLRDLAQTLADIAGTKVVFQVPSALEAQGFSKATKAVLNAAKLRELGWKPQYDIKAGLKRTIELLRQSKLEK